MENPGQMLCPLEVFLEAARPPKQPPRLFPSKRFQPRENLDVVPVLSPDNYMQLGEGWLLFSVC